jgi:hypothetical protein
VSEELPAPDDLGSASATPPNTAPTRHGVFVPRWGVVVVVLAVFFGGGIAIGRWAIGTSSTTAAGQGSPSTSTAPATPTDPDASALSGLVVQQADVGSTVNVRLLTGGNQVSGQPTLDLCNGTFPSESHRTARLQVVALDSQGNSLLSTEAVLYSSVDGSAQAFSELKAVAAKCPASPVVSPVGEPTVTTHFNAAPDADWPQMPTVDRLAFGFTTTDQSGQTQHSIAVYLRRGRALMGIYFSQPDSTQPTISGQTTIAGIVNVFATRLAQLPGSTVNSR